MEFSGKLVELARALKGNITEEHRQHAMSLIRDSLAISLAASTTSSIYQTAARAFSKQGYGESSVLSMRGKLPAESAAFLNSAAAHSLDYDDTHDEARLHTTTVVLPAILAVAEQEGVSGDNFLSAFIVSSEVMCRLGLAARPKGTGPTSMWFMTQLLGYPAATLGAGLALGLSDEELVSALGISLSQSAGAKETAVGVGSDVRAIYPAFASSSAVSSVLLAQAGLVGPSRSFEGKAGLWPAFFGEELSEEISTEILDTEELREFLNIVIKPWPSCRMAHPYIDAVTSLEFGNEEILAVKLGVSPSAYRLCVPEHSRRNPETLPDACFSVPFMTAAALVKGVIDLESVTSELLHDPEVLRVANLIEVEVTEPDAPGNPRGVLQLVTNKGTYQAVGSPSPVASTQQVRQKFDDCMKRSGLEKNAEEIWQLIGRIDQLPVHKFFTQLKQVLPENFYQQNHT